MARKALNHAGDKLTLVSKYRRLLRKHWDQLSKDQIRLLEEALNNHGDDAATLARNWRTLLKQNGIKMDED